VESRRKTKEEPCFDQYFQGILLVPAQTFSINPRKFSVPIRVHPLRCAVSFFFFPSVADQRFYQCSSMVSFWLWLCLRGEIWVLTEILFARCSGFGGFIPCFRRSILVL
jgi:hypothetical protein